MLKLQLMLFFFSFECFASDPVNRPNIIFLLTDDQDVTLGGLTPMTKTKEFFADHGVQFANSFTAVPVCCPSRASILTGQYQHNHHVLNNSLNGNCYGHQWRSEQETNGTFATHLRSANYTTFFAGKYLNQYGIPPSTETKFVPPGWDHWNGLVGNSVYYNYSLSVDGRLEKHASDAKDYLTDLIHARASDFLEEYDAAGGRPFFMMLATPACHAPFTASLKHMGAFSNLTAPRTPNFNMSGGPSKHWLLRQTPSFLPNNSLGILDGIFCKRWATLLSVDDMLENLVDILRIKGLLNNTYIFFSSDNGYHLGQFSLPIDKRQMYEFDIRVPLLVAGPGIRRGTVKEPVVNVDLAPTFLELAGISVANSEIMDGKSLVPLLFVDVNSTSGTQWSRSTVLVEYQGEGRLPGTYDPNCPQYSQGGVSQCFPDCICEDAYNNTYSCARTITSSHNVVYCRFDDEESFVEVYNLNDDPHQLTNLAWYGLNDATFWTASGTLERLRTCRGQTCHF